MKSSPFECYAPFRGLFGKKKNLTRAYSGHQLFVSTSDLVHPVCEGRFSSSFRVWASCLKATCWLLFQVCHKLLRKTRPPWRWALTVRLPTTRRWYPHSPTNLWYQNVLCEAFNCNCVCILCHALYICIEVSAFALTVNGFTYVCVLRPSYGGLKNNAETSSSLSRTLPQAGMGMLTSSRNRLSPLWMSPIASDSAVHKSATSRVYEAFRPEHFPINAELGDSPISVFQFSTLLLQMVTMFVWEQLHHIVRLSWEIHISFALKKEL